MREHRERLGWSIHDLEEARASATARQVREEREAEEALARGEVLPGGTGGDVPFGPTAAKTSLGAGVGGIGSPGAGMIIKQKLADVASGESEEDEATAAEVSRLGESATAAAASPFSFEKGNGPLPQPPEAANGDGKLPSGSRRSISFRQNLTALKIAGGDDDNNGNDGRVEMVAVAPLPSSRGGGRRGGPDAMVASPSIVAASSPFRSPLAARIRAVWGADAPEPIVDLLLAPKAPKPEDEGSGHGNDDNGGDSSLIASALLTPLQAYMHVSGGSTCM